jgi:V/A-type H+-transporting ATPase subunit K
MISEAGIIALAQAIAISGTGLGAAWALKSVGTAAIGAITEDSSVFGKAIVFVAIPETIVIFGLVVAILIGFS